MNVRVNMSECDGRMELILTVTDVKRSVARRKARYGLNICHGELRGRRDTILTIPRLVFQPEHFLNVPRRRV